MAEPRYAAALHGDVKYPKTFIHFDYVNPDAPKEGSIRMGVVGTFDSLNPFIVKGSSGAGVSGLLYETLMEQSYDEAFSVYGLIAETIDIFPNGDGVSFILRPQAKWHDGKPITAEDVKWSFETLMSEGAPFYKAYYADVKDVKTDGTRKVIFTFKTNTNKELPLVIGQMPILPKHFFENPLHKFGTTSLVPPLGSGAYKISDVQAGRSLGYERVKDWWGKDLNINKGRYNFDRIEFIYFKDTNVALEAFFAGAFDVQEESIAKLWATAYDAPPIIDGRIIKEEIQNSRPSGLQGWLYNLRRPIFKDHAVRRALGHAFDFEWSNKQFAFNAYARTHSFFENSELSAKGLPSGRELEILNQLKDKINSNVFTTELTAPKTDGTGNNRDNLKLATKILDDAGYRLGKDGVRVHETTGQRLEFEIIDSNPAFERWTLPFIRNLKKIGVIATYRTIDPAQFQNRIQNFDFDMTSGVIAQSDSPGNEQLEYWTSAKADITGSRNYMGVKNPVVDELVTMIINAKNRDDLVASTRALDRVLWSEHIVIPHWYVGVWRIARWKYIERPKNLSGKTPAILDTWWSIK
jgi:microcin C transport system substrate-binding protein